MIFKESQKVKELLELWKDIICENELLTGFKNHRLGGSNAGGVAVNSNVPKGKKMAGRLGNETVTVQNLNS